VKAICDVHLPKRLVAFLNEQDIETIHGSDILDSWYTRDKDFCKYSDENDYVFITKDNDFRNSHFLQNTPRRLIKINLGNISNDNLILAFQNQLSSFIQAFKNTNVYVEVNRDFTSVVIR
jgi:predicted nuclease of predicted toxin-antitoxin system